MWQGDTYGGVIELALPAIIEDGTYDIIVYNEINKGVKKTNIASIAKVGENNRGNNKNSI